MNTITGKMKVSMAKYKKGEKDFEKSLKKVFTFNSSMIQYNQEIKGFPKRRIENEELQ